MCCRAQTPKIFQVRANMMINKKSVKQFFLLRPNATTSIFFTFVVFCCRNKKMLLKYCPTIKEHFLFRKLFSKSISNVSKYKKVTLVLRGGICIICEKIFEVWGSLYKKTIRPLKFFLREFLKNLSKKCSKLVGKDAWKNLSNFLKY